MNRKVYVILLGLLALLLLGACGDGQDREGYVVFYLNTEGTKIVPQEIELESTNGIAMVEELLAALQTQPSDATVRQTIPTNVKVLGYKGSSYQLTVDFSQEYYQLSPTDEILTRAAIAKTLLQVEEYSYVMFTVESQPLLNYSGELVGSMNADTFVENPGGQINASQQTTLTL